jgi:hypothetical protein
LKEQVKIVVNYLNNNKITTLNMCSEITRRVKANLPAKRKELAGKAQMPEV